MYSRYALPGAVLVTLLTLLTLACSSSSSEPGAVGWTPEMERTQGTSRPTEVLVSTKMLDCIGADGIRKIRAEYAANHIQAEETYIGQRVCLRGTISGFFEDERIGGVGAKVGDDADFSLRHINSDNRSGPLETAGEELNSWHVWRAWMMESNVGDAVEAECRIKTFAPTKQDPKRTRGTPLFDDCQRVVDGVLWTPLLQHLSRR